MHFLLKTVSLVGLAISTALPAFAEKLTGQEVASLFARGQISFQAGSVWTTEAGNRYTLTHPNSSGETGSFKIFSNGTIERHDEATGRKTRYHFDRASDGTISAVYGNGSRYAIK
ncbi:hypothetical protein DKT77_13625 [Meridianimarinicoccus roseus]|jgi:hypothetical protein|uniref:Uncharacterized protein n=1 Tax=Meridianimarinicoccus roseus TaxID=2072018 RepID=A0A2V2L9A6_9RHOB|nr:hypothetical protein [Meridianimarinicoccus roseus]PWR02038.1 hypothetical protein DKT77_13625 [Meridianimarinicoccus roseus]